MPKIKQERFELEEMITHLPDSSEISITERLKQICEQSEKELQKCEAENIQNILKNRRKSESFIPVVKLTKNIFSPNTALTDIYKNALKMRKMKETPSNSKESFSNKRKQYIESARKKNMKLVESLEKTSSQKDMQVLLNRLPSNIIINKQMVSPTKEQTPKTTTRVTRQSLPAKKTPLNKELLVEWLPLQSEGINNKKTYLNDELTIEPSPLTPNTPLLITQPPAAPQPSVEKSPSQKPTRFNNEVTIKPMLNNPAFTYMLKAPLKTYSPRKRTVLLDKLAKTSQVILNVSPNHVLTKPPILKPKVAQTITNESEIITNTLKESIAKVENIFHNAIKEIITSPQLAEIHNAIIGNMQNQIKQMSWDHENAINKLKREHEEEIRRVKLKQWCGKCLNEATLFCCSHASYCSRTCQEDHWVYHNEVCERNTH